MRGILYIEDGSVFKGYGFGAECTKAGTLVYSTSMSGYEKVLSDPAYTAQVVTMTYPLIGNYGINPEDMDSDKVVAFGMIAKDISKTPSNEKCKMTVDEWLKGENTPGVYGVDTRKIAKKIRDAGSMKCVISTEDKTVAELKAICEAYEPEKDLMKHAGVQEYMHFEGEGKKVALLDLGVNRQLINGMKARGYDAHIFPYGSTIDDILGVEPDGVIVAGGPGFAADEPELIELMKELIENVPVLGIDTGHQLMALAMGGKVYKMKTGHRGVNLGVYDKATGKSYITDQNHQYAVDGESLVFKGMEMTHINLNDMTVEGMKHRSLPIMSVQFHPEFKKGHQGTSYVIDAFDKYMED